MMSKIYDLRVMFKSNESPFTGGTEASGTVVTDAAARNWARGMAESLGNAYTCTLLKNGAVMSMEEQPEDDEDESLC